MKKLRKLNGGCAVLAVHYVSKCTEEKVLSICREHGFEEARGMYDKEWRAAAKILGVSTRKKRMPKKILLKDFCKQYPDGTYFVSTNGHLFVVDNGLIIDPRMGEKPYRQVLDVWDIKKVSRRLKK